MTMRRIIGSTNVKGVLLSETSEIVAKSSVKFEYDYPNENYVEISAEKYIDACLNVISSLSKDLPKDSEITGISQASASGNLLLLDSDNNPITPIYNWQDGRVTDEVKSILGEDFNYQKYYEKIGWPLGTKFPLAQLCYIKCHNPDLLSNTSMVCMSTEYLNYILTGKFGIGPSAGTPFFLIDQNTNAYDKEILNVLGITEQMLPPILKTGELLGTVTDDMCKKCGLSPDTKVYCGTFDHPSCAISTGVTEEGKMLLSCGTSWVAFMPINNRDIIIKNRFLCDTFLSDQGGPWGAMYSIASIGNTIENFINKYISADSNKYAKLTEYAENSKNGSNGLILNPQDIDNAEILNFSKENIAYAIMEMPARLLKEKLNIFMNSGLEFDKVYMAGGPTKSDIWVSTTENIINLPINVSDAEYSGAVGAGMLARK